MKQPRHDILRTTLHTSRYLLTALLCFIVCACTGNKHKTAVSHAPQKKHSKTIVRQFPVYGDFNCVTNISSLRVVWQSGPCNVWAEGDSVIVSNLLYDNDSGGVTFSLASEENFDMSQYDMQTCATIYVCSPTLRIVANCGAGCIHCQGIVHGDDVLMGGIGSGSVEADTVQCKTFKFESSKATDGRFGLIQCDDSKILSYGSAQVTAQIEANNEAVFDCGGSSTIQTIAKAHKVAWVSTGNAGGSLESNTIDLSVSHQSLGELQLQGHASVMDIKKGSRSKLVNQMH